MNGSVSWDLLIALVLLSIAFTALVVVRPRLTRRAGGPFVAFLTLFLLPMACLWAGFTVHMENSKTTKFCLSCHVMEGHGQSLLTDDDFALPAAHFQNRRINREEACFTCHTQYTMFGDYKAKLNGLRHVYIYYTGQTPEKIELYSPFQNRECLHCHSGARSFEENHEDDRAELETNELSCLECHDVAHDIENLADAKRWRPDLDEVLKNTPPAEGSP